VSVSWSLDAGQLIQRAYRVTGQLSTPYNMTDDQATQGILALNGMLKGWQADGISLYRQERVTLTVPAMTAAITIIPRVMGVEQVSWVVQGGVNPYYRPMGEFSWVDYFNLPNPQSNTTSGPSVWMFNKQDDSSSLYIWPLATLGGQIVASVGRVVNDVNALSDSVDFPDEWTEAAIYGLADRLIDDQGVAQMDPETTRRISMRAAALYAKLCDFDRPSSVWIRPWDRNGSGLTYRR
jgi:hypothetical protein